MPSPAATIGGAIIKVGGDIIADCDCCLCANGYPPLKVTLTWTDADLTKSFLGQTFTNGETRLICPHIYECRTFVDPNLLTLVHSELWSYDGPNDMRIVGRGKTFSFGTVISMYDSAQITMRAQSTIGQLRMSKATGDFGSFFFTFTSSNIATKWTPASGLVPHFPIDDKSFGQTTSTAGVTIKWERRFASDWNICGGDPCCFP